MGNPLDGLRSIAAAVKRAPTRAETPRPVWATVSTAGTVPTVILDDDEAQVPREVSANAAGALQAGWRVRVELQGRRITVVSAPQQMVDMAARVALLETAGPWIDCALGSGFTGSARVRKLSPTVAEFRAALSGSFVDGNTGGLCTLPAGFVPVGGEPRIGAYLAGAHPGICYLGTSGIVGVNQRSGATRATLDARGTYGLN